MKKNGGIPLFGNIFTNADRKSELELAIELNSRLQAVLEDILHKNITLKVSLVLLTHEKFQTILYYIIIHNLYLFIIICYLFILFYILYLYYCLYYFIY